MSEDAQVIIAVGVTILLTALGALGIIWSLRCNPKAPHYRLPAVVALSVPLSVSVVWTLGRLF
jgi:hypothetical protein